MYGKLPGKSLNLDLVFYSGLLVTQFYWLQVNFAEGELLFFQPSTTSQHSHLLEKMMRTLTEPLPYSNNSSFCLQCTVIGCSDKKVIHYDQVVISKNKLEQLHWYVNPEHPTSVAVLAMNYMI